MIECVRLPPEERLMTSNNPMCEVFPKVAVCNYQRYGRGGGQETKAALCVLSLNMINDKVILNVKINRVLGSEYSIYFYY